MSLLKVKDLDVYTWKDGRMLSFTYRPADGFVRAANKPSTERAIEYFCYKKYRINWKESNTAQGILQVIIPDHIAEGEEVALLASSLDEMDATTIRKAAEAQAKLILNNVDNSTGEVIKEKYLSDTMARINKTANKTREDIAAWFNQYNIEVIRPDNPVIICSTKSKCVIIKEGRKLIWQLFEKGQLRKLTKDEYQSKIDKHTNDKVDNSVDQKKENVKESEDQQKKSVK